MGNRLSKIVTRTGDTGTTGLGDGSRIAKNSPRVEAIGSVDELNSLVGLLNSSPGLPDDISRLLLRIQHDLFDLGGELAVPRLEEGPVQMVHPAVSKLPATEPALPGRRRAAPSGGSERERAWGLHVSHL